MGLFPYNPNDWVSSIIINVEGNMQENKLIYVSIHQ